MTGETEAIRFSHVSANGVALHVAEAGPADGPLLILLHGFPEFWFGWRGLIPSLAARGFHVVAPDQRGYNLSDKPAGVDAYRLDALTADIFALADRFGARSFQLVGHDWGAAVAWTMAERDPTRVRRLAILNAPHPAIWFAAMRDDPMQRRKSRYVRIFRLPLLPEAILHARRFAPLTQALDNRARAEAFTAADIAAYRAAWTQPGAPTGMVNWYRALFRAPPVAPTASLIAPTLILWGDRDVFIRRELAERSAALCVDARVVHLPNATHWIAHDEPATVTAHLLEFFDSCS